MIRLWSRVLLYFFLAGFIPMMAIGQTIPFAGLYDESLSNAKISGGLLLGVRSGTDAGKFEPRSVGLFVTADLAGKPVCVDIHSRDARYSARNTYDIPSGLAGKIGYFAVDTKFGKLLDEYETRDMAVLIRTEACSGKPGKTILPAVLGRTALTGQTPTRQLTVYLNEDPDMLKVTLKASNGAKSSEASCSGKTQVLASAYLASCTVTMPPAGGQFSLQVQIEGVLSSPPPITFTVEIPSP